MIRQRTRSKSLAKAEAKLGPNISVVNYALGTTGPNPTNVRLAVFGGAVVVGIALSLFAHSPVVPGALVILLVYKSVVAPTGVVLTSHGYVLFNNSVLSGWPTAIRTTLLPEALGPEFAVHKGRYVHFPAQRLWMKEEEFALIAPNS